LRHDSTWRNNSALSLKEVMKDALKEMRMAETLKARRMEKLWRDMTGPVISAATSKVEYYKNKLVISLNNAPLRFELTMGKEKMLEQFNRHLEEEDKITEIILR